MFRSIHRSLVAAAVSSSFLAFFSGCDKDKSESAALAPSASALAPSKAAPSSKVVKFTIDPKGKTAIDMEAPKEHIKATTDSAAGTLEVDLMNLANTRGEVKVDLSTLKTSTFNDASKDSAQTGHALTWLEVADAEKEKLPDEVKTQNRYAVFAIRSVDGLNASDLSKVEASTSGSGDEVKTVSLVAHGEFLLHGRKMNKDIPLEVSFRVASGSAKDAIPTQIDVTTKSPFSVILAEHDVKPRDSFGKIAKGAFNLFGTKVAETAKITMEMHARP